MLLITFANTPKFLTKTSCSPDAALSAPVLLVYNQYFILFETLSNSSLPFFQYLILLLGSPVISNFSDVVIAFGINQRIIGNYTKVPVKLIIEDDFLSTQLLFQNNDLNQYKLHRLKPDLYHDKVFYFCCCNILVLCEFLLHHRHTIIFWLSHHGNYFFYIFIVHDVFSDFVFLSKARLHAFQYLS